MWGDRGKVMNIFVKSTLVASIFCTALVGTFPAYGKELPRVLILATGGTIAGVSNNNSAVGGYDSGKVKANDLVNAVPQIKEVANCDVEQFCNIGSQDMNGQVWVKLNERVNNALVNQHYDAVVITHGTDTMEETAYFLENTLQSDSPVVFVGAMRPTSAISPDGPSNLYDAIKVAIDPDSKKRGVLVTMGGDIFESRDIYKSDINSLYSYASRCCGPVGSVDEGVVNFYAPPIPAERPCWGVPPDAVLPRVDILHAYAGCTGDSIDAAVNCGARGIVIAGVGNGNMSKDYIEAVKRAVGKGVIVVRSSRVTKGFVNRNHEISDDELGTVASYDLSPEHARILLQLIIYHLDNEPTQKDKLNVQKCFEGKYFLKR